MVNTLTENSVIASRFLLNYVSRFLLLGWVVSFCIYLGIKNYNYYFFWHIFLCTFGYVPLMAESILLFTGDDVWCRQLDRKTKNKIHGYLITLSTAMVITGNAILFHFSTEHLNTVHGITGFISMIFVIASVFLGLAVHNAQEVRQYVNIPTVWLKFSHNVTGLIGYIVGIVSLAFSFYTRWFSFFTDKDIRLVLTVFTALGSAWTINGAIKSLVHQLRTILKK